MDDVCTKVSPLGNRFELLVTNSSLLRHNFGEDLSVVDVPAEKKSFQENRLNGRKVRTRPPFIFPPTLTVGPD